MNILIDGRTLVGTPRGVGQYLANSLVALARKRPNWDFVLAAPKPIDEFVERRLNALGNVSVVVNPPRVLKQINLYWFLTQFAALIRQINPDVVWYPGTLALPFKPKGVRELVTVHDLVAKEHRDTMSGINRLVNALFLDNSIKRADILWAVSHYTAGEIERFFPKRRCRQIAVGSSVDLEFLASDPIDYECAKVALAEKLGLKADQKPLLFVGTLEPRKNLKYLLSLMPELAAKGHRLVVVGGRGWGQTDIAQVIGGEGFPKDDVIFAGYLTAEELRVLYRMSKCFVSTSLNEGFGMPQLEAIASGIPVVTSDNSAMSEVVTGAGILVDGWDQKSWIDAIERASVNVEHYARKIEQYRWEKQIEQVVDLIEGR